MPAPTDKQARDKKTRAAVAEAASQATSSVLAPDAAEPRSGRGRKRAADPLVGEIRHQLLPLLVLHFIAAGPSYGNQLIERVAELTAGVISINPNTMYPLLRELESKGMIEGEWEHPDRRTRRFYAITDAGRAEYERLQTELSPFLDSMIRTVTLIKREIYGEG